MTSSTDWRAATCGASVPAIACRRLPWSTGFGGLNVDETADVLKVSAATVMRDWSTAEAWLYRELAGGTRDGR